MSKSVLVATAAIACACLSSGAGAAADRMSVHARVSHAGLDLKQPAGRAELKRRIAIAARTACTPAGNTRRALDDADRCTREMMQDGDMQVAALSGTAIQVAAR